MKHAPWQIKHVASKAEATKFLLSLMGTAWGVECNKVNRANKTYTSGYTIRWYWKTVKEITKQ
jgi:hypothetical protein